MSFVSRVLRQWGYVRLEDYGLILTADGRVVPSADWASSFAAPSWQSFELPMVPSPPPVAAAPVRAAAMPVVAIAAVDDMEDDEEEWEWRLALARAKAAIDSAEAEALTAPVKHVPRLAPVMIEPVVEAVVEPSTIAAAAEPATVAIAPDPMPFVPDPVVWEPIVVIGADTPLAAILDDEPIDPPEEITMIAPIDSMRDAIAACLADDEDETPTVVGAEPARLAERIRREVHATILTEPVNRPAIEVVEEALAAAAAAAAAEAAEPPRRPRTQPLALVARPPGARRDMPAEISASAPSMAASPARGRPTPPPIPERARRVTPPIRLESDVDHLTDDEIAAALSVDDDVTTAVDFERPHRRAATGTPAPLPRISSPRTPLPRLSAFLRTRGRR